MANRKFDAVEAYMPRSIVCVGNGIWDIELYVNSFDKPEIRFAREYWSSFARIWEDWTDDDFHFSVDGAGIPPKYVMDIARRMWLDNVG